MSSSTSPGIRTVTAREWRNRKIHEGWTLHQAHGSKKWHKYYLVLQKSHLLLFSSEQVSQETMVGTLSIGPKTEVKDLDLGSDTRGLCIELRTEAGSGDQKVNIFKFDKPNECDLWKAFIMGLSNGVVPESVNLLPGQRNNIMETVREVKPRPPPRQALDDIHSPQYNLSNNNNNGPRKVNHDYDEPANVTSHRSVSSDEITLSPVSRTQGRNGQFSGVPEGVNNVPLEIPESFANVFSPSLDLNVAQDSSVVFTSPTNSGNQFAFHANNSDDIVSNQSAGFVQSSGLAARNTGITQDALHSQPIGSTRTDSQASAWVQDSDLPLTASLLTIPSTSVGVSGRSSSSNIQPPYRAPSGFSHPVAAASRSASESISPPQRSNPLLETQTKTTVMHWLADQQEESPAGNHIPEVSQDSRNKLRSTRSADEASARGLSHTDVQRVAKSGKDEEGTVSSLRQLMRRQNELAFKALEKETVQRPSKSVSSKPTDAYLKRPGPPQVVSKSVTSEFSKMAEPSRSNFNEVSGFTEDVHQNPTVSPHDITRFSAARSSEIQRSNSPIIQNRVNQLLAATAHLGQPRAPSLDETDNNRAASPQNASSQRRYLSKPSTEQPVIPPRNIIGQSNAQRQPEVNALLENNQRIRKPSNQVIHPFYLDAKKNDNPPPWFMDCTRDKAETILSLARSSGNVLLRPSSTFTIDGKYVISFRTDILGGSQVHHYSVIRTPAGFLIDVENEHGPMSCLSQVLNFFVTVVPHSKLLGPVNLGEAFGQIFSGASSSSPVMDGSESAPHRSFNSAAASVRSTRFPETTQATGDWFHPVVDSMAACSFVADSDTGPVASEHGYPIY